jgi:capsular polysaccharide biosynthesis protein
MFTLFFQIFTIVRRWWWLLLAPAILLALSTLTVPRPMPTAMVTHYKTEVRFAPSLPPIQTDTFYFDTVLLRWQATEYIAAGFADWINTSAFANAVNKVLAAQGVDLSVAFLDDAIDANYTRSQVIFGVAAESTDLTPEQANTLVPQIANAAITVITEQNQPIFPQNGNEPVQVVVLDQPVVKSTVEGDDGLPLGRRFQLLLRTAVGLLVGGLFVLLAHFFDPFLHSGQDVQPILPVLGQIPKSTK